METLGETQSTTSKTMMTNLKQILEMSDRKGAAIPVFYMYNLESVMGVMQAAH